MDDYSRLFVLVWAAFIGTAARLVFESKQTKVTLGLFLSRYVVSMFMGYLVGAWLKYQPSLDVAYGPIIAGVALISYELMGVFITTVPQMVTGYFKKKYSSPAEGGDQK